MEKMLHPAKTPMINTRTIHRQRTHKRLELNDLYFFDADDSESGPVNSLCNFMIPFRFRRGG